MALKLIPPLQIRATVNVGRPLDSNRRGLVRIQSSGDEISLATRQIISSCLQRHSELFILGEFIQKIPSSLDFGLRNLVLLDNFEMCACVCVFLAELYCHAIVYYNLTYMNEHHAD